MTNSVRMKILVREREAMGMRIGCSYVLATTVLGNYECNDIAVYKGSSSKGMKQPFLQKLIKKQKLLPIFELPTSLARYKMPSLLSQFYPLFNGNSQTRHIFIRF